MIVVAITVVAVAALLALGDAAKLPADIERCSERDPDLNNCIKAAIIKAMPKLKNGIPSLGVPPLDPLHIPRLHMKAKNRGNINYGLEFINVDLTGTTDNVAQTVKVDTKTPKIILSSTVKRNVLSGPYKVNGKVLVLPIKGEGMCNLTLTDVDTEAEITGEFITKGGRRYMNTTDFKFKLNPGHVYTHLSNLFNGDPALGETMNTFLNENWRDIFNEMKPAIEEAFGQTFKEIANRIFLKVPYEEIFLP